MKKQTQGKDQTEEIALTKPDLLLLFDVKELILMFLLPNVHVPSFI
ncbi:hypothetical protein [Pontibacillus salipaludis]|nr:hypothetical protein [Pontibacillus salipaludis]